MIFKRYSLRFWTLCLSTFFFFISFNIILPQLNTFITLLGGEDYKGLIIGLFTIAALLSRPFSGRIADRVGRLPVIYVGTAVCIVMGLMYPLVHTVAAFLLLRFLHGFSTGFQPTGTTSYLADTISFSKRGEAMGLLGIAGSLGMSVGPALSDYIVPSLGLNALFYISSGAALISLLLLSSIEETLETREKFSLSSIAIWKEKIYDPGVLPAAFTMCFSTFSFGLALTIGPDYADYLGMPEKKGLFFSVYTLASLSSRFLAGKASDQYGRPPVILIALLFVIAGMLTIAFTGTAMGFFIGGAMFGIGGGMNSPSIFAWTIDLGSKGSRAKGVSTVFMGLELGIFSGAVLSAAIYDNNPENFKLTFLSGAAAAFITLCYIIWYIFKKRKASTS